MTPSYLRLSGVSVDYPIYNATNRSLKRSLLHFSTGGRIGLAADDRVVVQALRNLTINFEQGDRVGLVGANGAGKTTLLRVLAGVYEPTGGRIETSGRITTLFNLTLGMDMEATGDENILIRGLLLGLTRRQIREVRREIVEFSELGEFIDMPVRTYSTGMILRLGFSISTTIKPEILLMDEWISVGDANFVRKAEERTQSLIGDVGVLVIASHSARLIENTCNRAIWMDQGRIRLHGSPREVLDAFEQSASKVQ